MLDESNRRRHRPRGRIIEVFKVSGPVVVADGMKDAHMYDVCSVYEGNKGLIGEIVRLRGDKATIQVYESTEGLSPGDPVESLGHPLFVELAPGIIGSIYDGIQRPLNVLWEDQHKEYIEKGIKEPGIDRNKQWLFVPQMKEKAEVETGDILGTVEEKAIEHRIMVPFDEEGNRIKGIIKSIPESAEKYTVKDTIAIISLEDGTKEMKIQMLQEWPVRTKRSYKERLSPVLPLMTGQRVIDTFFPIAKGGTACIPGPFGSGKTVVQHQLAKWADADIIFFIGCGERGNEMAEVLREFPKLEDPKTGRGLMERTVLLANTSDMPVAAREASIYTGITMAEYYRDMGYDVALMADSTSRWAEALREVSGRLEEMPGEEGYPAYLSSRLAEFYERAGRVVTLGSDNKDPQYREGSISVIGAVSPPGGDFSEPVTQATLGLTKVFWALNSDLAFSRHFPAIHWLESYSLYLEKVGEWWNENVSDTWRSYRDEAMRILQEEDGLLKIVQLVGSENLPARDRVLLETAALIKEGFLHQNAYDNIDTYTSSSKQFDMLELIIDLHQWRLDALERGVRLDHILELEGREEISKLKYNPEKEKDKERAREGSKELFSEALSKLRKDLKEKMAPLEAGD